jgi:kinetochore protein NNF1
MAIDTEPPPPAAAEMDLDQADEAPPPTQQPEAAHHHEDDGGADAQSRGRATTSPPMPQKHVAVTPGPRAARLRDLHAQALHHTLAKLGWDNFAACFPTVARRNEPVLRQVQAQMVAKLADKVQKEFDNIMAARLVVPKLNDLEALVADAAQRRRAAAAAQGEQGDPTPYVAPLYSLLHHRWLSIC